MKKITLVIAVFFALANTYAQREQGFRVGLDFGVAVPSGGGSGLLFSLEPKYNIRDNMNVGLRMGVAAMVPTVIRIDGKNTSGHIAANGSYVTTYDYYFNKDGSSFAPYIGGGAGYYGVANFKLDDDVYYDSSEGRWETDGKFGALVRGGFEWAKFRMGVEYNMIPESLLQNNSGVKNGTVSNSYIGIHLGFFFGGGKWGG